MIPGRSYITLLVVAGVAAALFAWGAMGHQDAARLKRWAVVACASAGEPFVHVDHADPATGKQAKRLDRGVACAQRIADLAAFERETNRETAGVLVGALQEREGKTEADSAAAARDAKAARAATERMEKANAEIEEDRVSGDWFDALNELGGLR